MQRQAVGLGLMVLLLAGGAHGRADALQEVGAGSAAPVCVDDAVGDAGDGPDLLRSCSTALRTGVALSAEFVDDVVLAPNTSQAVRWTVGYTSLEVSVNEDSAVATHSSSNLSSPSGSPLACGEFRAAVDGAVVTVPYFPLRCVESAGSLYVTGPGGDVLEEGPPVPEPLGGDLILASGDDTVDMAVEWSRTTFPDGGALRVLLARHDLFADALVSAGLQAERFAPLLLTPTTTLDPRTAAELERLGARSVTILGGEVAIGPEVAQALADRGLAVERVGGASRIETAVAIAERTDNEVSQYFRPTATVLRGFATLDPTSAFADALALGALGDSRHHKPFLLTASDALSPGTAERLPATDEEADVVLVGGEAAIGPAVAAELQDRGYQVSRLAGPNRFATAVAIASAQLGGGSSDVVVLVDGVAPDAWAAGFAAAGHVTAAGAGAAIVLADGAALPDETRAYLAELGQRPSLVCAPAVASTACQAALDALDG